ncbi:MAG: BrnT family toxin [Gammaproteobacteria bacterium]
MNYSLLMNLEWDDDKSNRCLENRGFDFAYAALVFLDPDRVVFEDNRFEYGEDRYIMVGRVEGRLFVIAYTPRGDSIRIISARKANAREIKRYETGSNDD